ncbi:hypothetical protein P3S68_003777 [Capsicum galapagoense]
MITKTSIMLGLGETDNELKEAMADLRAIDVDILTLGQYLENRYVQAEELKRSRPIDDQGNPIMPLEEETLSCWLNIVGGMYKGRTMTFARRKPFIAFSMDCKVYEVLPPCQMSSQRRCNRKFESLLGSTRRNKKEGWRRSNIRRHLSQTSKNSRLK